MSIESTLTETGPAVSLRLEAYAEMYRIRVFEQRAARYAMSNMTTGPIHLATGQEAVSVGFAACRQEQDSMLCTYRGHGHAISWGAPLAGLMKEMLGRSGGVCGGKGGSLHLTSAEHGFLGSYAIIGAQLPIANGVALSHRLRGTGGVAVCFFGDGGTNIGAFHEALNLAAVWSLPVVFVCENNLYMEYTTTTEVTAVKNPAFDRAAANGVPAELIDGNDLVAVEQAAGRAFDRARAGDGPTLIEALTYRHTGHAHGDPAKYRPADEVEAWLARDPLPAYRALLTAGGVGEADIASAERAVDDEVSAACDETEADAMADPAVILRDLWADGSSGWRH
ncbi:pyruvate dehydrogenase (acetyl-transferring) E1 component subunit alpha [Pseudonocardia ailaonensis]|uniref:Pyruvate dehydrogenase (Acetyl-transferring) E1 component subunit alpha n=1 Tax=Pseudonocardia ailaonensis TaxID=367279 RepID=A0ABN2N3W5_9PSEU